MTMVDTSVVVAGFGTWHEHHPHAHRVLAGRPNVSEHVLLETYATLTGLPPPHRAPASVVHEFLRRQFRRDPRRLTRTGISELLAATAQLGIVGGAVYDAAIGLAAKQVGERLITLDRRAVRTYRLLEVDHDVLT